MKTVCHFPSDSSGYAVYNDLEQMFHSYNELGCFHDCGPVLDLQHISPEGSKGGLSGLAQVCDRINCTSMLFSA